MNTLQAARSFRSVIAGAVTAMVMAAVLPGHVDSSLASADDSARPVNRAEARAAKLLRPDNLVAWCIVPFDARQRGPEQRAAMLKSLGLKRCAYDWRQKHVPTFEAEIQAYRQQGIEFFAFWGVHEKAFTLFEKYKLHPQIWLTAPSPKGGTDAEKTAAAVKSLLPVVRRTQKLKFPLGLYNHGGWGGEPTNLVAVCRALREQGFDHVGIVYNFHHGHAQIENWSDAFRLMQPYVLCLNINGMNTAAQPKILPVGRGEHETAMLQVVLDSGYDGPIGVLDHRSELDARESLQQNLTGIRRIRQQFANAKRP